MIIEIRMNIAGNKEIELKLIPMDTTYGIIACEDEIEVLSIKTIKETN